SVQSHPLFLFLINSLVPWNYFFVNRSERERVKLAGRIDAIFEEFSWFDSMASLGIFRRYLTDKFPVFAEELNFLNAQHPLIAQNKNVANDFSWPSDKKLILIT